MMRISVGLTIFSTDSKPFLLPLIIIDSKINSRIFLALLLHIILLPYGLLSLFDNPICTGQWPLSNITFGHFRMLLLLFKH